MTARAAHDSIFPMHGMMAFLRRNPQVLVLLIICLVLGLGTFLAVVLGLVSAGSTKVTGEPVGLLVRTVQLPW